MYRLTNILVTMFSLLLLSACSAVIDGEDGEAMPEAGNYYVNFAIAVNNGTNITRAGEVPTGGENGDGREAGFERENAISGITIILYQDANGINTTADPTLDFVRYYSVTLGGRDAQGTTYTDKTSEAYYTTGNQPLGTHSLDFTKTYHAIVIANAPQVAASLTEGTSKLSDIRNGTLSSVYLGSAMQSAASCTNFVMSSETDNTINFSSVTGTNLDGSTHTKGQDMLYNLESQPLVIERMAARIDFWSKNSNGYKTSADNAAYTTPGYEYDVTGTSDKFVVTGIVPFNLVNGHADYGNEYLIKRLTDDLANASTTTKYLQDETATSYVLDPKTLEKVESATPNLTNPLANVYGGIASLESNSYYHSIADMHASEAKLTISDKENVVVAYPMENTLIPTSKLYYHATGVALIGYYYYGGTGTGERYVYLGYLRHQGTESSYDISPSTTPYATTDAMGAAKAMQYSVVRNNIYRISINSIDSKGNITLRIVVKKWDPFTHATIYM